MVQYTQTLFLLSKTSEWCCVTEAVFERRVGVIDSGLMPFSKSLIKESHCKTRDFQHPWSNGFKQSNNSPSGSLQVIVDSEGCLSVECPPDVPTSLARKRPINWPLNRLVVEFLTKSSDSQRKSIDSFHEVVVNETSLVFQE